MISAFEDRPRPQVTKFVSGDDLDGDFVIEETSSGNKGKSASKVGSASDSKEGNVKSKKKEGTKVVNFVG